MSFWNVRKWTQKSLQQEHKTLRTIQQTRPCLSSGFGERTRNDTFHEQKENDGDEQRHHLLGKQASINSCQKNVIYGKIASSLTFHSFPVDTII